jgi:hypothetical protein
MLDEKEKGPSMVYRKFSHRGIMKKNLRNSGSLDKKATKNPRLHVEKQGKKG